MVYRLNGSMDGDFCVDAVFIYIRRNTNYCVLMKENEVHKCVVSVVLEYTIVECRSMNKGNSSYFFVLFFVCCCFSYFYSEISVFTYFDKKTWAYHDPLISTIIIFYYIYVLTAALRKVMFI